jgi:DNA-binding NarL/FixJ family response regulator
MGVAGMIGKTSLLVIAHSPRFRYGLTGLLNEQPDMTAMAVDPDWSAAQAAVMKFRPELILLDSCLGASYCRRLCAVSQAVDSPRLIVMDLVGGAEEVIGFVESGCSGLILKNTTPEHLLTTIRSVSSGGTFLPASLTGTIFSYVARRAAGREANSRGTVMLTQREHEVMGLIAEGLSNKEIAGKLHIVVHTVKSHVHVILEKLALHTRLEIAAFALRQPVVASPSPAK